MNSNNVRLPQDGAPSDTAKHHHSISFMYLQSEKSLLSIEFTMWYENSTDMYLIDYAVWGAVQQRV